MKSSETWLGSVSDMMSGLMMVFLLISIAFMLEMKTDTEKCKTAEEKIKSITAEYSLLQEKLYADLRAKFKDDLDRWNAELDRDSTVRFKEPDVLFAPGRAELRDRFKNILLEFFPAYIEVLTRPEYINEIDEVRIEGHTSTNWEGATELNDRYLNNARLSQERALSVLQFVFPLAGVAPDRDWLVTKLRANGLSFARPISQRGVENSDLSRRVEFRAMTKTRERILQVIGVVETADPPSD